MNILFDYFSSQNKAFILEPRIVEITWWHTLQITNIELPVWWSYAFNLWTYRNLDYFLLLIYSEDTFLKVKFSANWEQQLMELRIVVNTLVLVYWSVLSQNAELSWKQTGKDSLGNYSLPSINYQDCMK